MHTNPNAKRRTLQTSRKQTRDRSATNKNGSSLENALSKNGSASVTNNASRKFQKYLSIELIEKGLQQK
jgi:hypothetical protein